MERISFEENVLLYKTKVTSKTLLENTVNEIKLFFKSSPYAKKDNYTYMEDWSSFDFQNEMKPKNSIEEIIKFGIQSCHKLRCEDKSPFNRVSINSWINVVRKGKPKQDDFKKDGRVTLHNHIDIQKSINSFHPTYTFVYYVQMPDNLTGNEGTLIVGGKNGKRYYHLPEEGDLIIMDGYLPHSPDKSPNSTKNRIVIAANVGFENVKKSNSLI
jgi:hypothetical protein